MSKIQGCVNPCYYHVFPWAHNVNENAMAHTNSFPPEVFNSPRVRSALVRHAHKKAYRCGSKSATGEAELWLFGDYLEVGQRHSCYSFLVFPSLVPKCDCWVWSGVGASRMQGIRNRIDISWNPVVYGSEQSSLEFFPAV